MKVTDEELNNKVKKTLQVSFSNFEGDFGAAFDKNILKSLRKPLWKRPYFIWPIIVLVIGLGTGTLLLVSTFQIDRIVSKEETVFPGISQKKIISSTFTPNENLRTGSKRDITKNQKKAKIRSKLLEISHVKPKRNVNAIINSSMPSSDIVFQTTNPTAHESFNVQKFQLRKSLTVQYGIDSSIIPGNITTSHQDSHDSVIVTPTLATVKNRNIIENLIALPLPEILVSREKPQISRLPILGRSFFLLSFTPTKFYNGLYLEPGINSRIQDVTLTKPPMSFGMKISAGIEIRGTQFLLNYSQLNKKINYSLATKNFKAEEISPGQYLIKRLGDRRELQLTGRMYGIGIKKQFDFEFAGRKELFATIGGDYLHSFRPLNLNQVQANFTIGKKFKLNSRAEFTLGSYFEYGLTKQAFANDQIQVRQYQYGISLGFKLIRKKINPN